MPTVPGLGGLGSGLSLGQLIMGGGAAGGQMPDFGQLLQQMIGQQFGLPAMPQTGGGSPQFPRFPIPPAATPPPRPQLTPLQFFQQKIAHGARSGGGDAQGRGPGGGFAKPERDFRDWSGL